MPGPDPNPNPNHVPGATLDLHVSGQRRTVCLDDLKLAGVVDVNATGEPKDSIRYRMATDVSPARVRGRVMVRVRVRVRVRVYHLVAALLDSLPSGNRCKPG